MKLVRVKKADNQSDAKNYVMKYCSDWQKIIANRFPLLDFVGITFHGDEKLGYWVSTEIRADFDRNWKEARQIGMQIVTASKELEKIEKLVKNLVKEKFTELKLVK